MKILFQKNSSIKSEPTAGFVALFAILASTLVLAMAISIFTIAYKTELLAGTSQQSLYADYAADTGIECALYADMKDTPSPFTSNPGAVNCVGVNSGILVTPANPGVSDIYTFRINTNGYGVGGTPRPSCADVYVDKSGVDGSGNSTTHIVSRGYNVDCDALNKLVTNDAGKVSSRIVERRMEVYYATTDGPGPNGGGTPSIDIWVVGNQSNNSVGENIIAPPTPEFDGGSDSTYTVYYKGSNVTGCTINSSSVSDPNNQTLEGLALGFPLGVNYSQLHVIDCVSKIDGASLNDSVIVTKSGGGNNGNPASAHIWASFSDYLYSGSFNTHYPNGTMLTISDNDGTSVGFYTIGWDLSNTNSCNISVSPTGGTTAPGGGVVWPMNNLSSTGVQSVSLTSHGTWTYTMSGCKNSSNGNSLPTETVTVKWVAAAPTPTLDFLIRLPNESYHTWAAGLQGGATGQLIINKTNSIPWGASNPCMDSVCDANQTVYLKWDGVGISNCKAASAYRLSSDSIPGWNGQVSDSDVDVPVTVTHFGDSKFTLTCDKSTGGTITKTLYAFLGLELRRDSSASDQAPAEGIIKIPENINQFLSFSISSKGGKGGTLSSNGSAGIDSYFNTSITNLFTLIGGGGGQQSQSIGVSALGGIGGIPTYNSALLPTISILCTKTGASGGSTTTVTGGAGGMYNNGLPSNSKGSTTACDNGLGQTTYFDGTIGANGDTTHTGGGGGGSGAGISSRMDTTPGATYPFKATGSMTLTLSGKNSPNF